MNIGRLTPRVGLVSVPRPTPCSRPQVASVWWCPPTAYKPARNTQNWEAALTMLNSSLIPTSCA